MMMWRKLTLITGGSRWFNLAHVAFISPNREGGGCTLHLDTSASLSVKEDAHTVLMTDSGNIWRSWGQLTDPTIENSGGRA